MRTVTDLRFFKKRSWKRFSKRYFPVSRFFRWWVRHGARRRQMSMEVLNQRQPG